MKGFDALGEAIPRVLATRDDLHFVFVGVDRVPRVPNRYGDHLTAVGRVDPAEMPRYFARADVFLHPSLSEGLPRVLGEALFSHTPVLARDVGEIGSVTDNTFTTNDEMVSMLLDFEDLPLDDPTPLSRSSLRPDYVDFYTKFY
jgi:glycosyltransferase involved in cell wall biosynthesis